MQGDTKKNFYRCPGEGNVRSGLSLSRSGQGIPGIVTRPLVPGQPCRRRAQMPSRVKGLAEMGVRRETVVHKQPFFYIYNSFVSCRN